jgi:hypothetical protein
VSGDWEWKGDPYGYPKAAVFCCNHAIRERIFSAILRYSSTSYHHWRLMKGTFVHWETPKDQAIVELKTGVSRLLWVKKAALVFLGITQQCISCTDQSPSGCGIDLSITEASVDNHSSHQVKNETFQSGKIAVQTSSHQRLSRIPSGIVKPLPLPNNNAHTETHNNHPSLDLQYDDYASAPLYDSTPGKIPDIWSFDITGLSIIPGIWVSWKDRGYRLHPQFSSTILSELPAGHEDHFLPFSPNTLADMDDKSKNCAPESLDSKIYSLSQLLDEAGSVENTVQSQNALVGGRDRANKLIQLDLDKDGVKLPINQVQISGDIDSLVWITDKFSANSMDLHLNIDFGGRPPFSVDNFITVNLIHPPLDESERRIPRNRHCGGVKLSNIPHMEFSHSGQDHRRVNFIVFFPRMIWKHGQSGRHRYQTLLPKDVQELWISEVVIPACKEIFANDLGINEYLPGSVQELHWKSGDRKHQSVTLTSAASIANLIRNMKHQVQINPALLGRYGSFFFAADARGIKLVTKQCLQGKSHPELADIFSAFHDLNWNYMLDRSKGELYLDLGLSFHTRQDIPVVGLWRLDKLHNSYGLMGTKKGDVHHFSTLGHYGGQKAALKKERQQAVHLISRISYNLAFEIVRNPGPAEYICSNIEAVKLSDRFTKACQSWLNLFNEGMQRSYGVRDEVRGTAAAIQDLLKVAHLKVQCYILSRPLQFLLTLDFRDRNFSKMIQFCGYHQQHFSSLYLGDFKNYLTSRRDLL